MKPKIVCIGGGTGQSEILRGLKLFDCDLTAIVAVTDSGRSTGVIRKNFDIPAPGDVRNCITALSDSEPLMKRLFEYRFDKGNELEGMSLGNLFLTALTRIKGGLGEAVKESSQILNIKGTVLPSTEKNTHVCAELENGTIVEEELNVRNPDKGKIKKLFLKDKYVKSSKDVVNAILEADLIVVGPGSLYTSVLVHFLIPNLKKAFIKSKAKKVFLCNMVTQSGQTDGFDAEDHLKEIIKYVGEGVIDYILLNEKAPPANLMKEYEKEGGYLLKIDEEAIKSHGIEIVKADILKKENEKTKEWNKISSIRHDPHKASNVLIKLINKQTNMKALILAAGNSTRMRPFSFSESKTMIYFRGKPLLAYHVDECINNGIKDIIIVCNKSNRTKIKNYFNKNYEENISFVIQEKQEGVSHAILSAQKLLRGTHFLLKLGDSLSSIDETKLILKEYEKNKKIGTVITIRKIDEPEEYGIAKFDNSNKIVEIVEKPKKNAPSKFANVGLCVLDADMFFDAFEKIGNKEVPPPQYILETGGKASYWVTEAKRLDIGRAWNILEANKLLIEKFGGRIESKNISSTAKIGKNVYIGPNAFIGDHVVIEGYSSVDSYIGKGSNIIDSFIMKGTKIGKNCKIRSSVIGKNNYIEDNFETLINTKDGDIKIYVKGKYVNPSLKEVGIFTGANVLIMENIKSSPGKMVFPNKLIKNNIKEDKLIRAILFDADNTIYATKDAAKKADMAAMKIFGKEIGLKTDEVYNKWKELIKPLINEKDPKKRTRKHSFSLLSKEMGLGNIKEGYKEFMKELISNLKLMEGFNDIFPYLSDYKLAVFTEDTSDLTLPKLQKFNLVKKFDTIITSDKIGKMKPTKKYYEEIFKKLKIQPNECLVIGDNFEKDLKIAKEFGATTVCYGNEDRRADFSIQNYKKLGEILNQI